MSQPTVPVQLQVPTYIRCAASAPSGFYAPPILAVAEQLSASPLASVAFRPSMMRIQVPAEQVTRWQMAGIDVRTLLEVAAALVAAHSIASPDPMTRHEIENEIAAEAAHDGLPLPPTASLAARETWLDIRNDAEAEGGAVPLRLTTVAS